MKTNNWIGSRKHTTILQHMLVYGLLIILLALGYSFFISGISILLGTSIQADNPYLVGIVIFILFFVFNPLQIKIRALVNRVFALNQIRYQEQLQAFNTDLTQSMKLQEIVNLLRKHLNEALTPQTVHIYLFDTLTDQYYATPTQENKPSSDLRFPSSNPFAQFFIHNPHPLHLKNHEAFPEQLLSIQPWLTLLGAVLYIPLPGQHNLVGWIGLLPRLSGMAYTHHDVHFLADLADQATMAIERAQVIADLERRVHEMNVLTRFSQGINVTLTFDDTLELIYAHTSLLIPTRDFLITMYDAHNDALYHAFYLEDDERLPQRENQPIPFGQGLEREIIRSHQALVTVDYERECRKRGTLPEIRDIYSWIGVPLNTGAETIGVLSLGSRNADIIYTGEQANLLQAIADQAAGAIVKSRLLQDAERRTLQLTTLNEVAQGISSTLALQPLLHEILQGAIRFLNCEAGSLFIVDQHSKELVQQAAIGDEAQGALNQVKSVKLSWLDKAVADQKSLIINDINGTPDQDEEYLLDFTSKGDNFLIVPMILKDEITGVLTVTNRKDGMPFSLDDQGLLTAFTSQAAIALENARLYTSTDQILAERVEELSVMQRIDQELNASLDVNRAMRITLEWAMRQSNVTAGLIGMIAEDGLRVIASQGYSNELGAFEGGLIPKTFTPIQVAAKSKQPQRIQLTDKNSQSILTDAVTQITIPIQRDVDVIGVLLLEKNQPGDDSTETLAFLSRLCDHAAIAIANARLYSEVQAANQAKNDFISFVSHELKTPMTSIRGFTDLLASNIVGPINETQSNFLGTIRSNVDRMSTLVSDLADVSRIEAGRIRLEFTAVPVNEVVDEVVNSLRAQIEAKEQEIDIQIPINLPPMWGDRTRLVQILTNLVSNANKYSPEESHITIAAEFLDRTVAQGASKLVHLLVKDNGYGISPEHQNQIFQKFYRADDQKIRDTAGTGLGLNISKQLIELQGGLIWFESVFRNGSTFHITIPIAEIESI